MKLPRIQVMYVTKWRGKQIAAVQDRRQESMYVLLEDLASCSQSISIAQVTHTHIPTPTTSVVSPVRDYTNFCLDYIGYDTML